MQFEFDNEIINIYINFLSQNKTKILLLLSHETYFIFYNEKYGVNANDLNLKFDYDGIIRYNKDVLFYVGFDQKKLNFYYDNINKFYEIIIMDKNKLMLENKNKKNFLYRKGTFVESPLLKYCTIIKEKTEDKSKDTTNDITEDKLKEKSEDKQNMISKIKSLSFDFLDDLSPLKNNFKKSKSDLCLHDDFDVI